MRFPRLAHPSHCAHSRGMCRRGGTAAGRGTDAAGTAGCRAILQPHAAGTVSAANTGGRPPGKEPQRLLGELWMCSFDSYRQHGYPFRRRGHRLRKGLAAGWVTTKGRAEVQVQTGGRPTRPGVRIPGLETWKRDRRCSRREGRGQAAGVGHGEDLVSCPPSCAQGVLRSQQPPRQGPWPIVGAPAARMQPRPAGVRSSCQTVTAASTLAHAVSPALVREARSRAQGHPVADVLRQDPGPVPSVLMRRRQGVWRTAWVREARVRILFPALLTPERVTSAKTFRPVPRSPSPVQGAGWSLPAAELARLDTEGKTSPSLVPGVHR